MKKTLLLTLLGAMTASQVMAVDLFITGSTAFRKNAHDACKNLFVGSAPTIQYDTIPLAGGDKSSGNGNPVWTMTGTAAAGITALGGGSLTIHADFTGSVQGMQTVENKIKILFLQTDGKLMTNTPTIALSDVASGSTPYAATGNFSEEKVAVQPFVVVKSAATTLNAVTNVTWEQLKYLHSAGNIPLSAWTGNTADYNTLVYMLHRTRDSGTRRTFFAMLGAGFSEGITTYNFDVTNNTFYLASGTTLGSLGGTGCGVIGGSVGYNNANLAWSQGYIGGGDIAKAVGTNMSANVSLAYLSFGDARTIFAPVANNWSQVISLNGLWPTTAGAGIHGTVATNDFTPITLGFYPYWAYEIMVYPNVDPSSLSGDQNLTAAQLGKQTTAGTILGVLDKVNSLVPISGSIDFEIKNSQTPGANGGATAIRLVDMTSSRSAVGGSISP